MAAPQGPLNYYNFENNIITLNGRRLGVWAQDGGVSYAPQSDDVQSDVGADGIVHYSGLNDDRLRVTVTLMENSPSVAYLMQLREAQKQAMKQGRVIPTLAWGHRDPSVGDIIVSPYAVFVTFPTINKARTIGTREFQLELPYAKGNINLANIAANQLLA